LQQQNIKLNTYPNQSEEVEDTSNNETDQDSIMISNNDIASPSKLNSPQQFCCSLGQQLSTPMAMVAFGDALTPTSKPCNFCCRVCKWAGQCHIVP